MSLVRAKCHFVSRFPRSPERQYLSRQCPRCGLTSLARALSFWWKVSSETNFDWLVFESPLVTNRISGEVDWQQQTVCDPARDQSVK